MPVKTHAGGQDEGSAPPASVNFPVVTSISEHYAVEDELRKGVLKKTVRFAHARILSNATLTSRTKYRLVCDVLSRKKSQADKCLDPRCLERHSSHRSSRRCQKGGARTPRLQV